MVLDRDRTFPDNGAAVDPRGHDMPAHAVRRFAVEQGPDRRVETGIGWQRTVMIVDRRDPAQIEHGLRKNDEIGDAEQIVDSGCPHPVQQCCRIGA